MPMQAVKSDWPPPESVDEQAESAYKRRSYRFKRVVLRPYMPTSSLGRIPAIEEQGFLEEQAFIEEQEFIEEQRKRENKTRSHTLKRVIRIFSPYKWQLGLVLLAILATTALNLTVPLLIPLVVDDALNHRNMSHLITYGIIMSGAAVLSGVIGVGQTYLNNLVGQQVMRDLRNTLYAQLQRLSLRFYTSMHTGEVQSRLSNDVGSAQSAVTDTFTTLVTNLAVVSGTVIAMIYLNPWLTLISFAFLPFFLFFAFRVGGAQRKSVKATQQSLASLTALMHETLSVSGILLIKTFGRKKFAQSQFEGRNQELMELSLYQQILGRWFFMFMNTFMTLMPVILYMVAGFLTIDMPGSFNISIGTLFAFVTLQGRFFGPFNQFSTSLVSAQSSLALFDRIFEYFDQEVEIEDAPDAVRFSPAQARGEVTFKAVSFAYNRSKSSDQEKNSADTPREDTASRRTLNNLSFTVNPGQFVALVGPSGAGKTTITYLIPRLYDVDSGVIEIDGHDVRTVELASLSDIIGIVTQETYLFHASVRDNLLYVCPDATDEEIIAATKAAAIHERIMELDNGYETIVGERGYKLSGGEKQRVAIARVLLKNPKILILDEATSALDTKSERLIQRALEQLTKGRTTIAIAHRLSTILAADLILVLDKGEIVERGTHQELLERGGVYAKLYNQQFDNQE
ncbi:multidrug ABC transporter ATP-binding protein [Ktedonobacteria bacterium brp13]|nr:multidrug ABC transporter ATP-binding protein [Ktedonobacteria bacterium brp13]